MPLGSPSSCLQSYWETVIVIKIIKLMLILCIFTYHFPDAVLNILHALLHLIFIITQRHKLYSHPLTAEGN